MGATVAVAPTLMEGATATVAAASDGSAILQVEVYARKAEAERGEADHGPPGGCVAPPVGDEGSMCHQRQVLEPPLITPSSSGAGPHLVGLDDEQEDGERSAKAKVRRRDGVGTPAPSGDGSVERRHSSCAEEREEPGTGSRHRAPCARQSECNDDRGTPTGAGTNGDEARRDRCDTGRLAKRRRATRHGPPSDVWMSPPSWLYLPHLGCGTGEPRHASGGEDGGRGDEASGTPRSSSRGRASVPDAGLALGGAAAMATTRAIARRGRADDGGVAAARRGTNRPQGPLHLHGRQRRGTRAPKRMAADGVPRRRRIDLPFAAAWRNGPIVTQR